MSENQNTTITRDQLNADIEAFLAAGGQVTEVAADVYKTDYRPKSGKKVKNEREENYQSFLSEISVDLAEA